MTDTVTPTTKQHVPSIVAYADVEMVVAQDGPMSERVEIRDETAITIASWWQSAGWDGSAFAALASGLPVEVSALHDQIASVRQNVSPRPEPADLNALDCLATWALNHPSREPAPDPMPMMRALLALQAAVPHLEWLLTEGDGMVTIIATLRPDQERFLLDARQMFAPIED